MSDNPFKQFGNKRKDREISNMPVLMSPDGVELVLVVPDDAFTFAGFFGMSTGRMYKEAVLQHEATAEAVMGFMAKSDAHERIEWFIPHKAKSAIILSLMADAMIKAAEALRYNGVSDTETVAASDERFSYEYRR